MRIPTRDRRRDPEHRVRAPFGLLAHAALRRRVRELRSVEAHWASEPNAGWVRWQRADGAFAYCGVRRRMDWITGEIGCSSEPHGLLELPVVDASRLPLTDDGRVALGELLHAQEKWWSSGGTEASLIERLDWLAQQLQLRLRSVLPESGRPGE